MVLWDLFSSLVAIGRISMFLSYSISNGQGWCSVRARKVSEMVSGPTSLSHTLVILLQSVMMDINLGRAIYTVIHNRYIVSTLYFPTLCPIQNTGYVSTLYVVAAQWQDTSERTRGAPITTTKTTCLPHQFPTPTPQPEQHLTHQFPTHNSPFTGPIDKCKRKETPQHERLKIIELKAKGYPYSKIGEETDFSVSKGGAHRIVKVWEDEQRVGNTPRPGRPEKYPNTDATQSLINASQAGPEATPEDITNDPALNVAPAIDISAKTSGRHLRSHDYCSFTIRVEENIEEKDKQQHVQ